MVLKGIWRHPFKINQRRFRSGKTIPGRYLSGLFWKLCIDGGSPADIFHHPSSPSLSSSLEVLSWFLSHSLLHYFKITWCLFPSEQICMDLFDFAMIFLMYLYIITFTLTCLLWKKHYQISQSFPTDHEKASAVGNLGHYLGGSIHGWELTLAVLQTPELSERIPFGSFLVA